MAAIRILKNEIRTMMSEMNIVKKLKSARFRNSKQFKFGVGGSVFGMGYLFLNKRVTSCEVETPEIKKSALMYDVTFRGNADLQLTGRVVFCWGKREVVL